MKVEAKVVSLGKILRQRLAIPPYQRSYRWQQHHVSQLFDDLVRHRTKQAYRLGTVVLHRNGGCDIVDGQQRLVTLTMLCSALDPYGRQHFSLLEHRFVSSSCIRALQRNSALIRHRVQHLSAPDRRALLDFLLKRCEVVCITLVDLGESFQFFDSQNARGKDLFPHDLLKAFHLSQMSGETQKARIACVEQWEEIARQDNGGKTLHGLQAILGDVLYPLRQWCMGESGICFDRTAIRVFKGVNLDSAPHPFVEPLRELDRALDNFPFQVNQPIINGRRFFEYVERYLTLYRRLFVDQHPCLASVLNVLESYEGRGRTGDHYVRNLFCASVLFYYDKFGEHELEKAIELCFAWSYRLRLNLQRVALESIDNAGLAHNGLIRAIRNAIDPSDVLSYMIEPMAPSDVRADTDKIEGLINAFEAMGYLHA
ncbi:MAG: DUF262 domain-containing protein [Azonexus sp.]